MSKIRNIVIYATELGIKKSCIFYEDGSVKEGTESEGYQAVMQVAKERGFNTPAAVRSMMNKDTIYAMSEKEFREKYNSFLPESAKITTTEEWKKEFDRFLKENNIEAKDASESVIPGVEYYPGEEKDDNEDEVVYQEKYEGSEYESFEDEADKKDVEEVEEEEEPELKKQSRNNGTVVAALVVAGAILLSPWLYSCAKRLTKQGQIFVNNITRKLTSEDENKTTTIPGVVGNNDLYTDYNFTQLLEVTTSESQKKAMINLDASLNGFNGSFADAWKESGNDIKAALTFDEAVALQMAYNTYSIDEVRAYFNSHEVNAIEMSNAYKAASLQLMGAYVIEDKNHPVDMSILIDSQEGRDFYNRYHSMYLAAKEATGDEQLRLVNEFYKAVRTDFAITEEERTEGIAHSESYAKLKAYQLSVAPMIAASEMIFQNLKTDYTLTDLEVDFINDIGLCNYADDKFERIETIMLGSYEDNSNPLFDQYRSAIINELTKNNKYVIDDAHRELANLRRFKIVVNGEESVYGGPTATRNSNEPTTTTTTNTRTWTETNTSTRTETSTETAPIPDDEKKKIDDQTDQENDDAKKKGEEEAEEERRRQQEEEDQKKKDIEDEVKKDDEDLQKGIDDANKTIDDNNKDKDPSNDKPVNEKDIGKNVDVDDNHSNKDGDVDKSVKDITTDGSGANKPLPDPNDTGKKFDQQTSTPATNSSTVTNNNSGSGSSNKHTESVDTGNGQRAEIEYDQDYPDYDADGNPVKTKTRKR